MTDWWEKGYPGGAPVGPSTIARPLYAEGNPAGRPASSDGPDVLAFKRAVSRLGRWPWQAFDDTYARGFANGKSGNVRETGVAGVQRQQGIDDTGMLGDQTYQALRYAKIPVGLPHAGEPAFDAPALELLQQSHEREESPTLGPVWSGGKSVLDHDCTHATGGIPLYAAFDDAFVPGRAIIAPEPLEVFMQSSSNPGDAFYAEGDSGLLYWFGHLTAAPANGRAFDVGEVVGYVLDHNVGGGPHVHVGVNVERLFGSGQMLTHHTDYSHGAPLIGKQLAAGRPL